MYDKNLFWNVLFNTWTWRDVFVFLLHKTIIWVNVGQDVWRHIVLSGDNELTHWGRDKMAAIFRTTFSNGFSWMKMYELQTKIPLKFVPKGPINNILALVQIMAWRRSGDKPLSESMMVNLPTPICIIRPQWVNWTYSLSIISMTFQAAFQPKSTSMSMSFSPFCLNRKPTPDYKKKH